MFWLMGGKNAVGYFLVALVMRKALPRVHSTNETCNAYVVQSLAVINFITLIVSCTNTTTAPSKLNFISSVGIPYIVVCPGFIKIVLH